MKRKKALIPIAVIGLIIAGTLAMFFAMRVFRVEKDKIGIIELRGALVAGEESTFYTTTGELWRAFESARRDERVKAVVLSVDSPGGPAATCYEMYSMVKRFEKPIVAFIRGVGASGSYLVSIGADKVVAHSFSEIGSIGVYIELREPVPVEPENAEEIYAISSGIFKTLWEDDVLDEIEREFLKTKVEETENSFFGIVFRETMLERKKLENVEENVGNIIYQLVEGGWFGGDKAFELGLVDTLGDLEDALRIASELAGIKLEEAKVVKIDPLPPETLEDRFYETPLYQDNEALPIYLK